MVSILSKGVAAGFVAVFVAFLFTVFVTRTLRAGALAARRLAVAAFALRAGLAVRTFTTGALASVAGLAATSAAFSAAFGASTASTALVSIFWLLVSSATV